MRWEEVRNIYPNQFVKFEILSSNIIDGKEYIEEIAVIGPVLEERATEELLNSKNNELVYHTSKEKIVLTIRTRSVFF